MSASSRSDAGPDRRRRASRGDAHDPWRRAGAWLTASLPGERSCRVAADALAGCGLLFWGVLWRTIVHPSHPLWIHAAFLALGVGAIAAGFGLGRAVARRIGDGPGAPPLSLVPVAIACLVLGELAAHRLGDEARWPAWTAFALAASVGLFVGELADPSRRRGRGRRLGVTVAAAGLALATTWTFFVPARWPGSTRVTVVPAPIEDAAGPAPRTFRYGVVDERNATGTPDGIPSRSVDARPLLASWSGFTGWLRTATFGFGPDALPLAGSVWLPADDRGRPHPLIVVVHGNHPMERVSHEGFAYLCDHLARRGYACVSVDMRFLNTSYVADAFGGLAGDRAARSWLLLEHLAQWRAWSHTEGHPFAGAVDLDDVGLVGHSRGGAVVAMAAEWNALGTLPGAPDVVLPERFGIRSVSGLAPIEVHGQPGAGPGLPALEGVSYLVVHGGRDADVRSFEGSLQYERTRTAGSPDAIKVALHLAHASHNPFNTLWAHGDKPLLLAPLVDRVPMLEADTQRIVTRVVLTHFLDAVHRGSPADRDWLRDPPPALVRLARGSVVHRFRDGRTLELVDFDEDEDPTTATLPGGVISSRGLASAREERTAGRWLDTRAESRALRLVWARRAGEPPPSWVLRLPDGAVGLGEQDALLLDLAVDGNAGCDGGRISVRVVLADAEGRRGLATVSDLAGGSCPADAGPYHAAYLDPPPEILFGTHSLRASDFAEIDPGFDAGRLRELRLVLDGVGARSLLLDGIGLWRADARREPGDASGREG